MNRIQRDCTTGLLTAKADTLVEGISETVSVLAWGVKRRERNEKRRQGDYREDSKFFEGRVRQGGAGAGRGQGWGSSLVQLDEGVGRGRRL